MNVVFILSDSHNPMFTGCYGHPLAETPNIDRIAINGTRFENSYCNSPLCVPARAALFTGRYVHEIETWCNSTPWDGKTRGWPHHLKDNGVLLVTTGKLDFMDGVSHGIEVELLGGHRKSLDVHSLYREQFIGPRWTEVRTIRQSGPRADLTEDQLHDHEVALRSVEWIERECPKDRPWVLNVNFSAPHPGWPCPPDIWEKWNARVKLADLSEKYFEPVEKLHPYHQVAARHECGMFATEEEMRRCHAAYLAHCEMMDRNVGRVLTALEKARILDDTLVIYGSDHGECCLAHRCFSKMVQYEDSIRTPLVMMGPGVKKGQVQKSPVSHLDVFPTIAEALGISRPCDFRGISLMPQCQGKKNAPQNDFVLCEYHANGTPAGVFSIVDGRYKYVECVGERPILFDLKSDPQELHDLIVEAPDADATKKAVARARERLCAICTPQGVDARAKKHQRILRDQLEQSGRLVKEIVKRGYEARTDKLVPRAEFIPDGYLPDGTRARA